MKINEHANEFKSSIDKEKALKGLAFAYASLNDNSTNAYIIKNKLHLIYEELKKIKL